MTITDPAIRHLDKIALPSRIGVHYGERIFGEDYRIFPFLALLEQEIIPAVTNKETEDFIIANLPPQVGKTSYSGILLPFWLIGTFPETRFIFITYSDDYSRSKGRQVRDLMEAFGPELFGVDVDPENRSASDWQLKGHRGGMLSVGIGSQITGRSGDVIVIDDVIKNIEEAGSPTAKKKHFEDYDGTIRTRLQPGGTIIITATRWAEDDLSGSILERQEQEGYLGDDADVFRTIEIPAIAEPPEADDLEWVDPLGRAVGEELECRFPPGHFKRIRNTMRGGGESDSFVFSCLFQQRPTARAGGLFPRHNWMYYVPAELPYMAETIRVWDLAATEGGGDWTVGAKVGKDGNGEWYVLDVIRRRLNASNVRELVRAAAKADGFLTKIRIEESRDGAGKSVVDFYKKDDQLAGYDIDGVKAEGQKESRAMPYSTLQNARHFWLPKDVDWVDAFVDEHRQMMGDGRKPKHDDQIDTVAYAVLELADSGPVVIADPYDFLEEADVIDMSSRAINDLWRRLGLMRAA